MRSLSEIVVLLGKATHDVNEEIMNKHDFFKNHVKQFQIQIVIKQLLYGRITSAVYR
jgi:hypothetical protein